MVMVGLVIFGVLAYVGMPLNITPAIDIPYVLVQTNYAGASPELIESQISKKIEDAVSMISGLDTIVSYSLENASLVLLKFNMDKNVDNYLKYALGYKDEVDAQFSDLIKDDWTKLLRNQPIHEQFLDGLNVATEGRITLNTLAHNCRFYVTYENSINRSPGWGGRSRARRSAPPPPAPPAPPRRCG